MPLTDRGPLLQKGAPFHICIHLIPFSQLHLKGLYTMSISIKSVIKAIATSALTSILVANAVTLAAHAKYCRQTSDAGRVCDTDLEKDKGICRMTSDAGRQCINDL